MARKKLVVADPLPGARAKAVARVNDHFNEIAAGEIQRDQAHAAKRVVAERVLAGEEPPAEFVEEAGLRGITAVALAQQISEKPDNAARRELDRQKLLLRIDACASPAQVEVALATISVTLAP